MYPSKETKPWLPVLAEELWKVSGYFSSSHASSWKNIPLERIIYLVLKQESKRAAHFPPQMLGILDGSCVTRPLVWRSGASASFETCDACNTLYAAHFSAYSGCKYITASVLNPDFSQALPVQAVCQMQDHAICTRSSKKVCIYFFIGKGTYRKGKISIYVLLAKGNCYSYHFRFKENELRGKGLSCKAKFIPEKTHALEFCGQQCQINE